MPVYNRRMIPDGSLEEVIKMKKLKVMKTNSEMEEKIQTFNLEKLIL